MRLDNLHLEARQAVSDEEDFNRAMQHHEATALLVVIVVVGLVTVFLVAVSW